MSYQCQCQHKTKSTGSARKINQDYKNKRRVNIKFTESDKGK